jgi:hypothetical protein
VTWKRHIYRLWDKKYIILVNFLASGTTVNFQLYAKTIASLVARLRPLRLTEICRNIALQAKARQHGKACSTETTKNLDGQ